MEKLKNLTFKITGKFKHYSRKEIKKVILKNGGKVETRLNIETDYLIAGYFPGSVVMKARALNIEMLSEKEFLLMLSKK